MHPLVSVIVPTFNSENNLRRFLESFKDSTFKQYEIIVNDDHRTTDNTATVINQARENEIPVRLIKENTMMAQARKAGANHANGEFIFHLDSDMEITPNLLLECVELMKIIDALVIPEESFGTTFWAKCKWLEKKMYEGVEQLESIRFIKTDIYNKLGGHNVNMVFSEDKDLDLRVREAGYKLGRTTSYLKHNEGNLSLIETLRKKLVYVKTANIFAERHPNHFRWQKNIFNRYLLYIKNIKYFFSYPLLYTGLIIMKTCEFIFAGIGLLLNKKK